MNLRVRICKPPVEACQLFGIDACERVGKLSALAECTPHSSLHLLLAVG
jgi:hypothetical protein